MTITPILEFTEVVEGGYPPHVPRAPLLKNRFLRQFHDHNYHIAFIAATILWKKFCECDLMHKNNTIPVFCMEKSSKNINISQSYHGYRCFEDKKYAMFYGSLWWMRKWLLPVAIYFLAPNRVPNIEKFDDFPSKKKCTFWHQKVAYFDPKIPTPDGSWTGYNRILTKNKHQLDVQKIV